MKLSRLLSGYLHEHKELTLAGMGHFTLSQAVVVSDDKKTAPQVDIAFRANPKAPIDPALVAYISSATGKMKALAQSDLESFLEIGQQLLNISKPFVITGIGSLVTGTDRQLTFVQGEGSHAEEKASQRRQGGHAEESEMNFEDKFFDRRNAGSVPSGRKLVVAALVGLGILTIGMVAWYFYQQSQAGDENTLVLQSPSSSAVNANPVTEDPSVTPTSVTDSTVVRTVDSAQSTENPLVATPQLAPPASFEIVLEIAKRNRALQRYADLKEWGHKVRMRTEDSITFKLSIPIDAPLSDSIRHRDSLSRFFGRKVWIETH